MNSIFEMSANVEGVAACGRAFTRFPEPPPPRLDSSYHASPPFEGSDPTLIFGATEMTPFFVKKLKSEVNESKL